ISQLLLPHINGKELVLATEIMIATPGIRNLVREEQTEQIPTLIQTGSQYGMRTMDKCLKEMFNQGKISLDVAMSKVKNIEEFRQL
ncbi:MAG: type IV pili twitching motility protein PilT, partial [Candidatus Omnitrophota bacterium]